MLMLSRRCCYANCLAPVLQFMAGQPTWIGAVVTSLSLRELAGTEESPALKKINTEIIGRYKLGMALLVKEIRHGRA